MSAGAATLTAAALVLAPTTAAAAPADDAVEAMQQAVDEARQAAEDAAQAAQDAAEAAQDAADQATQAAEDAAENAAENAEDAADDATGDGGDADEGLVDGDDQVDWMTEDLRNDLEALEGLSGDERAEELENIIRDAVTGDYGEQVENWTERMVDFMDVLPQELQSDVQNVLGMEPEAAQEELRQIWQGVMSGDYGEDVQMWGTWLRGSFQEWNLGDIITGDMSAEPADGN